MNLPASILDPKASVAVGIGIGAVDLLIFNQMLPNTADIRTARPQNTDVETERRKAVIYCVGVNGFISLVTRDWTVFLIGGMVTIGMSYMVAHANEINPDTGKMAGAAVQSVDNTMAGWAVPDYSMQQEESAA